jgi:hypothetical protein
MGVGQLYVTANKKKLSVTINHQQQLHHHSFAKPNVCKKFKLYLQILLVFKDDVAKQQYYLCFAEVDLFCSAKCNRNSSVLGPL